MVAFLSLPRGIFSLSKPISSICCSIILTSAISDTKLCTRTSSCDLTGALLAPASAAAAAGAAAALSVP